MVPQQSSSKNKKAALLLEDDIFSVGLRFGNYSSINGFGVQSHDSKLDSEIPVYFELECLRVIFLTANRVAVNFPCEFSAIAVDELSTNNAILNAWG